MKTAHRHKTIRQLTTYSLIGLLNTFVGLTCIFLLMWLRLSVYWANFFGYALGLSISFALNCKFTFNQHYTKTKFLKFVIGVIIAYLINLLAVYIVLQISPESKYIAQLTGVIFYTIFGFLINKFWALK